MTLETPPQESEPVSRSRASAGRSARRDRSWLGVLWYYYVRYMVTTLLASTGALRASGLRNVPRTGGALLVSNHMSHLDVFVLGLALPRTLNYVARSTLFVPVLGALIRSVGGFPIQREGKGTSGIKETLRRLREGRVVTFFPEGTRSLDGELGPLKPGIAALAERSHLPIVPAAIAGTFEGWPRHRTLPRAHPIWVHFGSPIQPEELADGTPEAITELIRVRILECQREARRGLASLNGN